MGIMKNELVKIARKTLPQGALEKTENIYCKTKKELL